MQRDERFLVSLIKKREFVILKNLINCYNKLTLIVANHRNSRILNLETLEYHIHIRFRYNMGWIIMTQSVRYLRALRKILEEKIEDEGSSF